MSPKEIYASGGFLVKTLPLHWGPPDKQPLTHPFIYSIINTGGPFGFIAKLWNEWLNGKDFTKPTLNITIRNKCKEAPTGEKLAVFYHFLSLTGWKEILSNSTR